MPIVHIISKLERGGTQRQLYLLIRESSRKHYILYFSKGEMYHDLKSLTNTLIFHFFSYKSLLCMLDKKLEVNFWLYNVFFLSYFFPISHQRTLHIRGSETPGNTNWSIKRRILFSLARYTSFLPRTRVVSNSSRALREYHICGFNKARGTVVDNIVDATSLNFSKVSWLNRKSYPIELLHITRYDTQKGNDFFETLIGLLLKKSSIRCTAAGEGVEFRFNHLVSKYGNRLRLYDKVPYDQIVDLYKKSDLLVITSRNEGLPNVVVEASHIGLPIFYTDVGDIKDYLKKRDKLGSLHNFEASSPEEMSMKILNYFEQNKLS